MGRKTIQPTSILAQTVDVLQCTHRFGVAIDVRHIEWYTTAQCFYTFDATVDDAIAPAVVQVENIRHLIGEEAVALHIGKVADILSSMACREEWIVRTRIKYKKKIMSKKEVSKYIILYSSRPFIFFFFYFASSDAIYTTYFLSSSSLFRSNYRLNYVPFLVSEFVLPYPFATL